MNRNNRNSQTKARQVNEKNPYVGVDCLQTGEADMRKQRIFETLIGKQQQFQLATQLVRMVLKIGALCRLALAGGVGFGCVCKDGID